MSDIQSFLQQASGQLGISESQAGSAVGGVLGLLKDKISADDSNALLGALPGAEKLMGASSNNTGGGGLMGGLMSAAGGLLNGKAGDALGVMGVLKSANLDTNQAGSLFKMLFEFVQSKAGKDLVGRILEQVPDLKGLVK